MPEKLRCNRALDSSIKLVSTYDFVWTLHPSFTVDVDIFGATKLSNYGFHLKEHEQSRLALAGQRV